MMITLRPVDQTNYRECIGLSVHEAQREFVASNVFSLAQAYVFYENARPVCIYSDDVMVGFAMYGPEDDGRMNIDRFMIDKAHQGKGLGKAAMAALLARIRAEYPAYEAAYLSFEPTNAVAERLYASFGFRKTGEMSGDECVAKLVFSD